MNALIIDDEPLARKRLNRLLEGHKNTIRVIGEASDGREGLELINKLKPDVVFLDIEMPVMNGFEMLKQLTHPPKIIFTTAFEEYAIKAFEENSIDYLLKPIENERLEKAIEKLRRLSSEPGGETLQLQKLISAISSKKEFKSFPVKVGDKIILLKPEDISHLEAREKYVFIITDQGNEYITDYTLTALEEKLPQPFLRVHRSFIINCDKIKEIHKGFSGSFIVILRDKNLTRIHTGRTYHDQVKALVEM